MTVGESVRSEWKGFVRKHWGIVAILGVAAVLVFVGSIYVFLWFVGDAQSSGLVPSSLSLWTMHNILWFILYGVFWEALIIGVPVAVAGVIIWQWWRRLPEGEWTGYHFGGRKRTTGGGGGSLFFFILFSIKVYIDGRWNSPIASWTLDYVVGSMILILAYVVVIFGVPAAIAGVWWVRREMKTP